MASINGVSLKSIKKFRDHEGCTAYQGTVCIDGREEGFWSQSYNGAVCDDFAFDTKELKKRAKQFKAGFPDWSKEKEFVDSESLLMSLVKLTEDEKFFKRFSKKGCNTLINVTDGYHDISIGGSYNVDLTNDEVIKMSEEMLSEYKSQMFKNRNAVVTVFRGLDDFTVTTGTGNPTPAMFWDYYPERKEQK